MRSHFPSPATASPPAEPQAEQRPLERTLHDLRLIDEYAWLKAENWREVMRDPLQRFLQRFGVGERALAIIVFGLQIGAYRRIELKRIAHHFAPVLRLEPGILVDEAKVVERALKGTLLRLRLGRRARGHWG